MNSDTLVVAFGDREGAHDAAESLRTEGFQKIWIGFIRADQALQSDDDSLSAKLGRYFSGESDGAGFVDTLMKHGVSEEEAERVERQLGRNDVILTVDPSNHPELAARIAEDCGGDVLSGESFVYTTIEWTAGDDRPGTQLLGYQNPTEYARGKRVDDEDVTRLRDERLRNATVPTIREDVFVISYDNAGDRVAR